MPGHPHERPRVIKINDTPIEAAEVEYGVLFDDGTVATCDDMVEAFQTVSFLGGGTKVVARKAYLTAWAEVSK